MPTDADPDADPARDALAALAEPDVIERAEAALEDVEAAADFVANVGLDRLGAAVAAAEGRRRARGASALAAYLRFRAAAADVDAGPDYFHRARGTHLRRDDEGSRR